jgi:hypothetical protein
MHAESRPVSASSRLNRLYSLRLTSFALQLIDISQPSSSSLGTTQSPVQLVPGLFSGGKAAGDVALTTLTTNEEVKERVELYAYSPPGPSWPVLG